MASDANVGLLKGSWITSYSGMQRFYPAPTRREGDSEEDFQNRVATLPPILGGYRWFPPEAGETEGMQTPERYIQRDGYFAVAALTCLRFDGQGGLVGTTRFSRGGTGGLTGNGFDKNSLTGTYSFDSPDEMNIFSGQFRTSHTNQGGFPVEQNYEFMMLSRDEIEWLWAFGSNRSVVGRGTLRRIGDFAPRANEQPSLGSTVRNNQPQG
jgi:hypothetical protein